MTTKQAKNKIEKNGYSITYCTSGTIIATKCNIRYTAKSINGLYNILFKTKY